MGYADPQYALSLHEFGEPRHLPRCGGWILVRSIPGTTYKDAMGCYPLFACLDWTKLHEDLEQVSSDLVSIALVTDTFGRLNLSYLESYFDLVQPFKTHFVADLNLPLESFVHKDHRYYARKSQKIMDIEVHCQPSQYLVDWMKLYDNLISRHHIKGVNTFSRKCFDIQLKIPGMVMFLGRREGEIVGATLVMIHDQEAYAHLSAYSNEGYRIRASYGIHWKALVYLQEQGIRFFDGGGSAGINENPSNGLSIFKKGWSNAIRMVYFCGRIFDRQKYESVCQRYQVGNVNYFPAYRAGEFRT